MSTSEQAGPPTEEARQQRDMEFLRVSQLRFLEGYRARMAEPHPMRRNAKGDALNVREQKWSYADLAAEKCPGRPARDNPKRLRERAWPAHEQERWIAGFLHADGIAAERGTLAMERADPSRPPPRPKREVVATQEDALLEEAPYIPRGEVREWWRQHHGFAKRHEDAGEQG